mmetsp:Transcript_15562/g.22551  ORF Transcript_15562/g.22551 Transcript_15562/m.22551 type:complete len:135 (-) Transcript_15562:146-550(-)
MGDNDFNGILPSEIFQLTNLVLLEMNDLGEKIRGSIPESIGRLSRLESLDAEEVLLTGTIPTQIGHCTSLKIFNVPSNELEGDFPSEVGALKELDYVDVKENKFKLPLPDEVCAIATDVPNFFVGSGACASKEA